MEIWDRRRTEICAGGMAYFASMSLDEKNSDLSQLQLFQH